MPDTNQMRVENADDALWAQDLKETWISHVRKQYERSWLGFEQDRRKAREYGKEPGRDIRFQLVLQSIRRVVYRMPLFTGQFGVHITRSVIQEAQRMVEHLKESVRFHPRLRRHPEIQETLELLRVEYVSRMQLSRQWHVPMHTRDAMPGYIRYG